MAQYQLPVIRNDGDTVKEQLNENAYEDVLPPRYLKKNEKGDVVEDQEDLFRRVAQNVALGDVPYLENNYSFDLDLLRDDVIKRHRKNKGELPDKEGDDHLSITEKTAKFLSYDVTTERLSDEDQESLEKKAEEFTDLMENLKFIPNTPTLANAGDELQMLSACVAGDVPVMTSDGLKEMSEVSVGDYVLTHKNRFKRVLSHTKTGEKDTMFMSSGTHNQKSYTLEATPDHEIFNGEDWVELQDVEDPENPEFDFDVPFPESFELYEYDDGISRELVSDGGVVKALNERDDMFGQFNNTMSRPYASIDNDEKLAYLFGAFISEGNVNGSSGVRFTLNANDAESIQKVEDCVEEVFGLEPVTQNREQTGDCVTISVGSKILHNFFKEVCGQTFDEKEIPLFVGNSSEGYRESLLEGLSLDALDHEKWKFQFANPTLTYQALMLGRSLGYEGTFNFKSEESLSESRTASCNFGEGPRLGNTVKKEANESVDVYDMTVEDDHSYLAGDYFVHNCFVDSPADDMRSIHNTSKEAAMVFQSGGGMGYGFWKLRPYGDPVGSTGGIASGPITFMRIFDQSCETIAQGGMRRGAQMGVMKVTHPDVIEFIHSKDKDVSLAHTLKLNDPDDFTHDSFAEALEEARDLIEGGKVPKHLRNAAEGHLSNFNISVGITDGFMEAVENDEEFTFTNPRTEEPHIATEKTVEMYELYGLGEYVTEGEVLSVPAKELWEKIAEGAHENGEPGVIFLERVNKEHSFDVDEHPNHVIQATNPCGEQPLEEYEACNLGHINLSTIVEEDRTIWPDYEGEYEPFLQQAIDWDELEYRARAGTRFLDNVVTMSDFPVEDIEQTVREMRKIGLGIMGLAHLFIQIGVPYGSDIGDYVAEEIMTFINHTSKDESHQLALDRGSFDDWEDSKYATPEEYKEWFEKQTGKSGAHWSSGYPIRNHNTTTIAPTGTTSMVGNTSGGCEPIYNVANFKNVSDDVQGDEMLVQFDEVFKQTLIENGIDPEPVKEEAYEQMMNNEFEGVTSLSDVPDELDDVFVTTGDLTARQHAGIQCACQKGVDSAISKTVNAPYDSTVEDAQETFRFIYENGGKGVTYYRDGTRAKQVLTTRQDNQDVDEELDAEQVVEYVSENADDGDFISQVIQAGDLDVFTEKEGEITPDERPDVLTGQTRKVETGYGSLYVTINRDQRGDIFEVMATVGKSGATMEADTEAIARLASLALRSGVAVEEVIDQLEGIEADRRGWHNGNQITSVADGIATALKESATNSSIPSAVTAGESQPEPQANTPTEEKADGGLDLGCPECGSETTLKEGCEKCVSCGWKAC